MGWLRIMLLAGLSGAAALSHELLWTRRLIDLLGATPWVTGRVLGLFFLGLALGGWSAARQQSRRLRPWRSLAMAELAIAVLALPAVWLPALTDWMWPWLGPDGLQGTAGQTFQFLTAAAVVLPPSFFMGRTLPCFLMVLGDRGRPDSGTGELWVYAANTLGGVLGLAVVSTVALESLGTQATMLAACALNLLTAGYAFLLDHKPDQAGAVGREALAIASRGNIASQPLPTGRLGRRGLVVLAFFSGALVLAVEVLVLRLLELVVPSSFHSVASMLANVILFLALGAVVVAVLGRSAMLREHLLPGGLALGSLALVLCPLLMYQQSRQLVGLTWLIAMQQRVPGSTLEYGWEVFSLVALVAGPTLICLGLVFPVLLAKSRDGDRVLATPGALLAFNGLGGLAGCELANHFLLPTWGIYGSFLVLAWSVGLAVPVIAVLSGQRRLAGWMVISLPGVLGWQSALLRLPYLSPQTRIRYEVEQTVFSSEGVLQVVRDPDDSRSLLQNNQYVLGSTGVAADERRQLVLPWLMHPAAREVCCLGLATGITAGALDGLEDPPAITAVELSAPVARAAQEKFREENRAFYRRAGSRIVIGDARVFVAANSGRFDLVMGDLFRPHGAGEGRLYTRENFSNVRRSLRPGGIFCQWLPAYQLQLRDFRSIAATFQQVFPQTLIVFGSRDGSQPTIGLAGRNDDQAWEGAELRALLARGQQLPGLDPEVVRDLPLLVAGTLRASGGQDSPAINTLDNCLIEIRAGKAWLLRDLRRGRPPETLASGTLSGPVWQEFQTWLAEATDPLPGFESVSRED